MTIAEYNKKFYPKISNAICFLQNIESAMRKTNDYEGAMQQLECIGWSEDLKETIGAALKCYQDVVKSQIE